MNRHELKLAEGVFLAQYPAGFSLAPGYAALTGFLLVSL